MSRVEDTYNIKTDSFEGPFDLLLYLVKGSKINLHDVSLAEITRGLIEYFNETGKLDLESCSNYILKVSLLLYLKSRILIPQSLAVEDEEIDERRKYVENLLEYQKYKSAALRLKETIDQKRVLVRRETQLFIDFKDRENWQEVSLVDLIVAFSRVAKDVDTSTFQSLEMENISIDDKIDEILNYFINNAELWFHTLFRSDVTRYELIITFLALLELVKMGKIYILQHKLFGNIKITKREKT
ncbi:MAG: segregation/condensation protein A [Spirochaetota bacterium]|nr:MAG: segregation/condensation protein A [Spirochaetota bacterium]